MNNILIQLIYELVRFEFPLSAITMAGTHGTNVAAGGPSGFPIGSGVGPVGSGVGAGGGTGTRALAMTPAQYVMTHLRNAGVPQGRPTGGAGLHYGSGGRATSRMSQSRRDRSPRPQRIRSRDRGHGGADMGVAESRFRTQPAGSQELQDWTVALEAVNYRLDTLERYSMLHAQSIAHLHENHGLPTGRLIR